MDHFSLLFQNKILISALIAWCTAQVSKACLYAILYKHFDWTRLIGDGGMPSAHSATVVSAVVACGLTHHFAEETGRHIDTLLKVAKILNVPVEIVTR